MSLRLRHVGIFLGPSAAAHDGYTKNIDLTELTEGQVYNYNIGTKPVLLLKPSPEQIASINSLSPHVWNKEYTSVDGIIALIGLSTSSKGPCLLKHKPVQKSLLVEDDSDAKWQGGYWDVTCEVSYDYAGRAIKDSRHSYNGYHEKVDNLAMPELSFNSKTEIVLKVLP